MNHLIITAHPNPQSLGVAICSEIAALSSERGNTVTFRNLYDIKFDPILSGDDLVSLNQGIIPEDIKQEQLYIANANHITFVFPLWWGGMPALLKGYLDRVLSYGFAYKVENGEVLGLLKGKKASVVCTTGTPDQIYQQNGMHNAMRVIMEDVTFAFCGVEPAGIIWAGSIGEMSREQGASIIQDIKNKMSKII